MRTMVPLEDVAAISGSPIDPAQRGDEVFDLYSLPAYDNGAPEIAPGLEIKSSKTLVSAGDVLLSKLNPRIPRVWLVDQPRGYRQIASTEFIPLRVRDKTRVDAEYLALMLAAPQFIGEVAKQVRSSTGSHQRVRPADVVGRLVPIPDRLDEQRRIVSRVKACMERVEEIESDGAEASREIDAVFPAILNERFAEILAAYPSQALEEVGDIRGGGSLPKGAPNDQGDASVLLVKVGDMNIEGNDRVIGVAREFLPTNEAGRNTIPSGAVVLPKRGGAIATNKKRLLGRPALIDPNLMAIVARPDVLSAEYLYYWSLTLDLAALSNGGVIPQLNRKDLAPLQVPIPPSGVQQQVVDSLKRAETYCGQLRTEFDDAQAERAQLRESILRKAFAGEL